MTKPSAAPLSKPSHAVMNGELVNWVDAKIHVWSEMAIRGTSIFEGIRGYWNRAESRYGIMAEVEHRNRMLRSARMLRIPADADYIERLFNDISFLLAKLNYEEDVYIRPTIFIESGRYGYRAEDVTIGSYIVAFPSPRNGRRPQPATAIVSSWRRLSDLTLSPAIKTGGAYESFRLPLIEAKESGADDAILLNSSGLVAETCGACIFLVRDGVLITPTLSSGILDSITRRKIIELARSLGIPIVERDVLRTELLIADEVFSCGTLAEVVPFVSVDHAIIGNGKPGKITMQLADEFNSIVEQPLDTNQWLTVPKFSDRS